MVSSRKNSRATEIDSGAASNWKKYAHYDLEIDPEQDDKATEIRLCSFSRPHMRAFHCSWWGFFIAFFIWFAIVPLLSEIREDLDITKREIWNSTIANFAAVIFVRLILGPLCDKFGSRVLFAVVLCIAAIPAACTGVIQNARDLIILRVFIGIAGGSFIMCQYWSTSMFTKEVVGTANALTAGWGNLGAGVTQLIVGSFLFPLFKAIFSGTDNPSEYAWRYVSLVPAIVAFITGVVIYFISDDYPKGNTHELLKNGAKHEVQITTAFAAACSNPATWLLFIQYACCFGVELAMNSASALYFKDEFGVSTESAAAIASIFGWMNLFARGVGGFISDHANARYGMRGRLYTQAIMLAMEGALVLIFASSTSLAGGIITLVCFSLFVQAAEGSTYGIVPYVEKRYDGAVCGIVGAGGNVGAVIFSVMFREFDYHKAFTWMGISVMCSSVVTALIWIRGETTMFCGHESAVHSIVDDEDLENEVEALRKVDSSEMDDH
ncbi:affinity nitrate transporter 2 [Seminavis robusta]|uniref:Nitrate/nitrite transporter n=1 Tax=Seminavis robusta TaxID=568900 RepID=A0A9N8H1H7_9STRA|nr:affinity nitrate transporter 2 [Seminavis robusta]|eukprot:Sro4_g003070.1 affinity nitrate transporter 2 (495) ;mRNA; r:37743-39546